MPPSVDKPHIPGGVSESCLFNSHEECRSPRCGCSCHKQAEVNEALSHISPELKAEKACPKCGIKRPANEIYCRIDGARLDSLLCGICGAGMNPEDAFCWKCSAAKGTARTPDIHTDNGNKAEQPEVDYARQVLAGLQEEISNAKPRDEGVVEGDQKVVEQPSGTQGSFKLVDKPNPNKIRGPSEVVPRVTQPRIRLPIKP